MGVLDQRDSPWCPLRRSTAARPWASRHRSVAPRRPTPSARTAPATPVSTRRLRRHRAARSDVPPGTGMGVAIAGRATPGRRPIRSSALAIVAPVLPALTIALALPSRTASAARTSELSFLRRTPCAGSSCISMTSDAGDDLKGRLADGVGLPDENDRNAVLIRGLLGAGDDLPGRLVTAHGVDRYGQHDGYFLAVVAALWAFIAAKNRVNRPRWPGGRRTTRSSGRRRGATWPGRIEGRRCGAARPASTRTPGACGSWPLRSSSWEQPRGYESFSWSRAAQRGSRSSGSCPQSTSFRLAPQTGQSPRHASRHSGASGSSSSTASRTSGATSISSPSRGYVSSSSLPALEQLANLRRDRSRRPDPGTAGTRPTTRAVTVPVARIAPPASDSRIRSARTSPVAAEPLTTASGKRPAKRRQMRRWPRLRRRSATPTRKAALLVLIEKRLVLAGGRALGQVRRRRSRSRPRCGPEGVTRSFSRPPWTVLAVRSSTISKAASFWSQ